MNWPSFAIGFATCLALVIIIVVVAIMKEADRVNKFTNEASQGDGAGGVDAGHFGSVSK